MKFKVVRLSAMLQGGNGGPEKARGLPWSQRQRWGRSGQLCVTIESGNICSFRASGISLWVTSWTPRVQLMLHAAGDRGLTTSLCFLLASLHVCSPDLWTQALDCSSLSCQRVR